MNLAEMLAALSPKRESLTIDGFTFYARPMSVAEFAEHLKPGNKNGRDEKSIFDCIVDENDKPVFENIAQVNALYTTVKQKLIGLVASASLMPEASEVEEAVK
ncbi:cytochrome [Salmonella enterica]|uniref:cytochrome n=1 Tax=Salmonella enterica TaxID=28901 RepID=UPI000D56D7EE|nr:cytochrome [Salmonella enterica]PVO50891.1 cytochrome [Salmonella enterica subsp. enterica serovar Newport]